jgi:hypothetical protein
MNRAVLLWRSRFSPWGCDFVLIGYTSKWCCSRGGAGLDVFAVAHQLREDPDLVSKTMALVKNLLHEGTLTSARLDES